MEVKELSKMTVAYIRHMGPYKGDDKLFESIWNRLFSWAGSRGLVGGKDFENCSKLDFLIPVHDNAHIKNLTLLKKKGEQEFLKNKRNW